MAKAATPIPAGFHSITSHLTIKTGAAEYIEFLKRAFDAVEIHRSPGPGGKLMHATVRIGDSMLMMNDFFPEFASGPMAEGSLPFALTLYVPDADATFAKATAAGAKVAMPLADQFWGDRYGQVIDPAGFRWAIATLKEILTPEEMHQRQKAAFGGH